MGCGLRPNFAQESLRFWDRSTSGNFANYREPPIVQSEYLANSRSAGGRSGCPAPGLPARVARMLR